MNTTENTISIVYNKKRGKIIGTWVKTIKIEKVDRTSGFIRMLNMNDKWTNESFSGEI